jgi:hypothetical protein
LGCEPALGVESVALGSDRQLDGARMSPGEQLRGELVARSLLVEEVQRDGLVDRQALGRRRGWLTESAFIWQLLAHGRLEAVKVSTTGRLPREKPSWLAALS